MHYDARPVGQEPHAGRVGLGSGRQPLRLRPRRQAPERRRQRRSPARSTAAPARWPTAAAPAGTRWRSRAPGGRRARGAHVVDFGVQQDSYQLRYLTSDIAGNYLADDAGALASNVQRPTPRLHSAVRAGRLALRDALEGGARRARRTLGGRATAAPTSRRTSSHSLCRRAASATSRPRRRCRGSGSRDTVLKASLGRAVRMPTVAELYGATSTDQLAVHQRPEPAAREVMDHRAERREGPGRRHCCALTFFAEDTRDALYSQTTFDAGGQPQHQPRAERRPHRAPPALEAGAATASDWLLKGPGPVRQRDLRRLEDQGERGLRRRAGRHHRQVAAQHPALARHGAGELPARRPLDAARSARATAARSTAR